MSGIEERLKQLSGFKKIDKDLLKLLEKKNINPDEIIVHTSCLMFLPHLSWNKLKAGELVVLKNAFIFNEKTGLLHTLHEVYFKNIANIYKTNTGKGLVTLRINDTCGLHFEFKGIDDNEADKIIEELLK